VRRRRPVIRGLALATLASCGLDVEQLEPSAISHVLRFEMPTSSVKPIDVLFVLDESPAMAAEHARVVASMAGFAAAFEAKLAGQDLNLGVITTDPGDHGRLVGGGFLHERSTIDTIEREFAGTLADHLTALADHEHADPAPNVVLDAIVQATDPSTNPGFRRDDATLFLVVITNRDDQSSGAVDDYRRRLGSTGSLRSYSVIVDHDPSPRLDSFAFWGVPEAGSYAFVSDVGYERYDVGVALIDHVLRGPYWRGSRCLEKRVATPHACSVSDVTNGIETAQLGECDASGVRPCWRFEASPQACGEPSLTVQVDRAAFPPPNTWIHGQCVTESSSN
jgi:hypothetical protein